MNTKTKLNLLLASLLLSSSCFAAEGYINTDSNSESKSKLNSNSYQCETDYECEVLGFKDLDVDYEKDYPLRSWGEWADAGCTEDSRYKDTDEARKFNQFCTEFEHKHNSN